MVLSNCTYTREVLLEDITYGFVEAFKYEGAYNQADITAAAKEFMTLDSTQVIFKFFILNLFSKSLDYLMNLNIL